MCLYRGMNRENGYFPEPFICLAQDLANFRPKCPRRRIREFSAGTVVVVLCWFSHSKSGGGLRGACH